MNADAVDAWYCDACTIRNRVESKYCAACKRPRSKSEGEPSSSKAKSDDNVNHPPHYTSAPATCACGRSIECIDVTRHMSFDLGNAVKYIWRVAFGNKGGPDTKVEDLEKAVWYIKDHIEQMKKGKK